MEPFLLTEENLGFSKRTLVIIGEQEGDIAFSIKFNLGSGFVIDFTVSEAELFKTHVLPVSRKRELTIPSLLNSSQIF